MLILILLPRPGFTALMCAADRHDSKSAQLLLEAGASVNCRGENGASALHLAALSGCLDCVQLLISYGHVVDCTDDFGWSPILYAHFKDHEECVLALLKANPQQVRMDPIYIHSFIGGSEMLVGGR